MTVSNFLIKAFKNNHLTLGETELKSLSPEINIHKPIKDLTDDDFLELGRIINRLYIKKIFFVSEIIALAKEHLKQIEESILLVYKIPQFNKNISYYNIFNLNLEGYDFANKERSTPILEKCLDTFLINSRLKYNFKLKPSADHFDQKKVRSTEDLLVLYVFEDDVNNLYYYFLNDRTETYRKLQESH